MNFRWELEAEGKFCSILFLGVQNVRRVFIPIAKLGKRLSRNCFEFSATQQGSRYNQENSRC